MTELAEISSENRLFHRLRAFFMPCIRQKATHTGSLEGRRKWGNGTLLRYHQFSIIGRRQTRRSQVSSKMTSICSNEVTSRHMMSSSANQKAYDRT